MTESGFAHVNGERLYYEIEGEGAALVLIHGWTLNLRMWDLQVGALSPRYRVIRYDRRGFGRSTGREDILWDAADLKVLLDGLGIVRAHVLGMSQGGRVALHFIRSYPAGVSSLLLQGSLGPEDFPLRWSGPDRVPMGEFGRLAREEGVEAFRSRWVQHPLMQIPDGRADIRSRVDQMLEAFDGGLLRNPAPLEGPDRPTTMDDLARIDVPVLVAIGDREVPYLQIVAHAVAYYVAAGRLAVIPGGGHLINIIAPAAYNTAVLAFLDSVDCVGGA